jgi:hypothetical protein
MATYERPEYDTPKGSAIDAILESSDMMVFWFPSRTKPGCYALKPRWEEYIAEFFPTLEYRQAEDLAMLMDPFANGTACVVGSKRELDYWLAEAERKDKEDAAA